MVGPARQRAASHTIGELEAIDAAVQLGIARPEAERLLDRAKQTEREASPARGEASPARGQDKAPEDLLREMLRLRSVRV